MSTEGIVLRRNSGVVVGVEMVDTKLLDGEMFDAVVGAVNKK